MTFQPLFFLPRTWLRWAYNQAMAEHLFDTPARWLFSSWDKYGIEFPWKGDTVLWSWPWRYRGDRRFLSIGLGGTGEFGDARFSSLAEIDRAWDECFETLRRVSFRDIEHEHPFDRLIETMKVTSESGRQAAGAVDALTVSI